MNDLIARQTVVQVAANVSVRLKDWAVNATSLEDVFLSIVKRYRQQ
jgi:hypothetical protein